MNNVFKWWEIRRVLFNILVVLTGVYGVYKGINHWGNSREFITADIWKYIIWGLITNCLYTAGAILEMVIRYFLSIKDNLTWYRVICFIIGTSIICFITFQKTWMYYVRIELF